MVPEELRQLLDRSRILAVIGAKAEPDKVLDHVAEVLAMRPRPQAAWMQLGIRNHEAAAQWAAAGIQVVQDRCMLVEHRRLLQR